MTEIQCGFAVEPTKDQIYIINETADKGLNLFKNLHGPITLEVKKRDMWCWVIIMTVPDEDRQFWLGFNAGKYLGINIGARNKETP